MPTFVGMLSWTDQGVRTVKDTPKRIQAARERAKKLGVEIKQVFLTTGEFDILVIAEANDGDSMAKMAWRRPRRGTCVRARYGPGPSPKLPS
jgi:uncharacterized protein with GYD domain